MRIGRDTSNRLGLLGLESCGTSGAICTSLRLGLLLVEEVRLLLSLLWQQTLFIHSEAGSEVSLPLYVHQLALSHDDVGYSFKTISSR